MTEEKRIYVVVPETIQVPHLVWDRLTTSHMENDTIPMCAGRLMAQCAHVVSLMRVDSQLDTNINTSEREGFTPITTIVLSVRNSKELTKVYNELYEMTEGFEVYDFMDTNFEVYGTPEPQSTAICTTPVEKSVIDSAIGHLELYSVRGM